MGECGGYRDRGQRLLRLKGAGLPVCVAGGAAACLGAVA